MVCDQLNSFYDLWCDLAPHLDKSLESAKASEEVSQWEDLLSLKAHQKILELPCGLGKYSFELAKRKRYFVTSCDPCEKFIFSNASNSFTKDFGIDWICTNPVELRKSEEYDAIICHSYFFGVDSEENPQVLRNYCNALRPGGKLLLYLIGRELQEVWFYPKYWQEQDGVYILTERKIDYDTGHLFETCSFLQKEGKVTSYTIKRTLYYASEIYELLEKTGFKNIEIFGGLDRSRYDEKASVLIVVGSKPIQANAYIRC